MVSLAIANLYTSKYSTAVTTKGKKTKQCLFIEGALFCLLPFPSMYSSKQHNYILFQYQQSWKSHGSVTDLRFCLLCPYPGHSWMSSRFMNIKMICKYPGKLCFIGPEYPGDSRFIGPNRASTKGWNLASLPGPRILEPVLQGYRC